MIRVTIKPIPSSFPIKSDNFTLPTGRNIALGKDTEQFPGAFTNGTSDKAVNGDTTHYSFADHCAHTEWNTSILEAWWRVDLGDTYNITGIKIYNRDRDSKFLTIYILY